MTVDAGFAEWLKADALYATAADADVSAHWGDRGIEAKIVSPIALIADAEIEAARQLAFLAGPNVIDRHVVIGARRDLLGRVVMLTGDRLGYSAIATPVFVFGVDEQEGTTILSIIRRLA